VQIGRERVDRTFLTDLDKTNLQLFMGAADPRTTRIYWAYKSVSGAPGFTTRYSVMIPRWIGSFQLSMSGEILIGISPTGTTLGKPRHAISSSIDALCGFAGFVRDRRAAANRAVRTLA
jgi:hypothetical protein